MSKKVEYHPLPARIRVPIDGLPPVQGWTLRLLEDIPDGAFKKGYLLAGWSVGADSVEFAFEAKPRYAFATEAEAIRASEGLLKYAEIKTEAVKI